MVLVGHILHADVVTEGNTQHVVYTASVTNSQAFLEYSELECQRIAGQQHEIIRASHWLLE